VPEFERIVIGHGDPAEGTLLVGPEQVWFLSLVDRVVGVLDGDRTYLAHSRRPIEQRSAPLGIPQEPAGVPVWDSPGMPLVAVPLGALATEEERSVPSLRPVTDAGERILADVRAGRLSPFVLQRFRRRAAELQFTLVNEGRERDAEREAAALETEMRASGPR